jgi:hypothetical protein
VFLNLAQAFAAQGQPRETVFRVHPLQLVRWLDEAWSAAANVPPITGATQPLLGSASIVDDLELPDQPNPPPLLVPSGIDPGVGNVDRWTEIIGPQAVSGSPGMIWHHLIYAYLVESTGAFEVFAEVVKQLVNGEGLGTLQPPSIRWLRSTEDLFFRDPPPYSISSVISELRPYARINRRQTFWRMFGFDLPHPMPGGVPGSMSSEVWKQAPGIVANTDFRSKWTELLRQVWIGLEYETATTSANPTDASYIALLCKTLEDMMNNRRRSGLLAREELAYVSTLSWFDLTLEADTSIVVDLKANGTSPDERLSKLAARVGMQPAARARELLQLAQPVATLMRSIELGLFSTAAQASALFAGNTPLTQDMRDIINLWQSATGDRVKDRPVGQPQPVETQPLRIPKPAATVSSNGGTR